MAAHRITMSFLMDIESKEEAHAIITGAMGESLEFLSVMETAEPRSERKPKTKSPWLKALVKQLTGK
jgi:hypothetical protein